MPTPISSGESYAFYLGDGATTTFDLGFGFLAEAHVLVQVDGTTLTDPDDYEILNGNAVFVVAPVLDADIRLIRVTPRNYDARLVDFRSFGAITEDEMDLNQLQVWYLIQEAMETDDAGDVNPNAEYISWDAVRSRWTATRSGSDQRIGDIALPAQGDEAANKDYVDGIAEWGIAGVPQGWTHTTSAGTTNYTLSEGTLLDPHYLIVSIDGVLQVPLVDFTVLAGSPNSTLVLLAVPPAAGLILNVMNFGKTRFINVTEVGTNAVGSTQIQAGAVTTAKIDDGAVTTAKIADTAVTNAKLGGGAVDTDQIADDAVTLDKVDQTTFTAAPGGGVDQVLKIREDTGALEAETITASDISDWIAALSAVRLDQLAAPNTDVSMGTKRILSVQNPTGPQDAATMDYVDTLVGAGVGSKIVQLADFSLPATSTNWLLFGSEPAWWANADYLYYEMVFSNWRWTGGGKLIARLLQSGVWREDIYWEEDPGVKTHSNDEPIVWTVQIYNPRDGADKPSFCSAAGRWPKTGWEPIIFGKIEGIELRGETATIEAGARCQVYGHRALV